MPSDRDYDDPDWNRLTFRKGDEPEKMRWSDLCQGCGHSRAEHLASPEAQGSLLALARCTYVQYKFAGKLAGKEMTKEQLKAVGKKCNCVRFS